jgi:hypothetical protein
MSQRAGEMMREDLESKGPVRLSEVETKQKEILQVVRRLADEGQITARRQSAKMRMSDVIPKERQSAYQRWEMTSFGEDKPSLSPLGSRRNSAASIAAALLQPPRRPPDCRDGRTDQARARRRMAEGLCSRAKKAAQPAWNRAAPRPWNRNA